MRYSVFAGGKRIRPILCLESARIFEAEVSPALYPGCAIEFIPHLFADSRRPARAGQRRFAPRKTDKPQEFGEATQFWRVMRC